MQIELPIMTWSKLVLVPSLLSSVIIGCTHQKSCSEAQKPNILFIMSDEMRWDYLGVAGHPSIKTPVLDQLAKSGFYFTRVYSPSPVSVPARVTLFTSRYSNVTGVTGNGSNTNQGEYYLPSILKHFGYHTGISGKLHFFPRVQDYGFDEFYSYTSEGTKEENTYLYYLKQHFGNINKYPVAEGTRIYPNDPLGSDLGKFKYENANYESYWITDHGLAFLNKQSSENPWFLFLSYNRPHSPSVLPEPYYSMYKDADIELPELPGRFSRKDTTTFGGRARGFVEDSEMAGKLIRSYMGAISLVDDRIGEVMDLLKKKNMSDNTIVVFTADHGNMLGDQGLWFKGHMWEGSSRVPLMIYVPQTLRNKIKQSRKVDEIVGLADIMPTLLDLIGVKDKVQGMQGESLMSLMNGKVVSWRNYAYSNLNDQLMIVEGDYKYIHYNKKVGLPEWEVFNLKKDPKEKVNLANTDSIKSKLPSIWTRMLKLSTEQPGPMKVEGMNIPDYATYPRPPQANDNVINYFGKKGKNISVY